VVSSTDLFQVLDRFFVDPPLAANQTTTTLGVISWVIAYANTLSVSPVGIADAKEVLRALLTIPMLWFQPNLLGNSTLSTTSRPFDRPRPDLPSKLYVTANLAPFQSRIIIAKWAVIVFTVLGSVLYLWGIAFLMWGIRIQGPKIGPFPLLEFAARVAAGGKHRRRTCYYSSTKCCRG
jgi:hypothetical protein